LLARPYSAAVRGRLRIESAPVIEEPRSLTSRVMRREPPTPSVIEEPPKFGLRTLWDKIASEPDPKRRRATVITLFAITTVFILDLSGVINGFAYHVLEIAFGIGGAAIEGRRRSRRWRWSRRRPPD